MRLALFAISSGPEVIRNSASQNPKLNLAADTGYLHFAESIAEFMLWRFFSNRQSWGASLQLLLSNTYFQPIDLIHSILKWLTILGSTELEQVTACGLLNQFFFRLRKQAV